MLVAESAGIRAKQPIETSFLGKYLAQHQHKMKTLAFLLAGTVLLMSRHSAATPILHLKLAETFDMQQAQPEAEFDGIWELCDNPADHTLQAKQVSIDPTPPKIGQDIRVRLDFTNRKRATSGLIKLDLRVGFIKIVKDVDLCQGLSDLGDQGCPIEEGDRSVEIKQMIPGMLPPLPVKGQVRVFDQDGALMTCVSLNFKLSKDGESAIAA